MLKYKRIWFLILIPISVAFIIVAKGFPAFTEHFLSKGLYKILSAGINFLTGWFPFSLMELSLVFFLLLMVWLLLVTVIKTYRNKGNRSSIVYKSILNLFCAISIFFFMYIFLCGVNYYRYPFSYHSKLNIEESSLTELEELCRSLSKEASDLSGEWSKAEMNVSTYQSMAKESVRTMKKLAEQYPALQRYYAEPKPILYSQLMSQMGITGIFWPFSMEANVNIKVPTYTIPATMCHELAHVNGFMREDEANYIAYLACKDSESKEFQYSGIMLALVHAGNQLYKEDKERYQELRDTYSTKMKRDFRFSSEYWAGFDDTTISQVSNTINDTYLKVNNQTDGVKSYGRMVDLLLAEYKQTVFDTSTPPPLHP